MPLTNENVQGITIKVKLKLNSPDDEAKLTLMMAQYRKACNYISQYVFDHDFEMNQLKIQKAIYHDLRARFGLKSMMAQSAIRGVISRYKTVNTQIKKKPYKYQDIYTGE